MDYVRYILGIQVNKNMSSSSDGSYSLYEYGTTIWYNKDDEIHRGDGLPAIIRPTGSTEYFVNGIRHRDGGLPAIDDDVANLKCWIENGVFHRKNGLPAVMKDRKFHWGYFLGPYFTFTELYYERGISYRKNRLIM